MNGNITYKFAKDLSLLYAKIKVKDVEACFLKVAQVFDEEVDKFLSKAIQLGYRGTFQKPEVFDTLILLARLKKDHPSGFSSSEFVKIFAFDEKLKFFIPIILSLREISVSKDYAILTPFRSILESSQNWKDTSVIKEPSGSIEQDIQKIDSLLREEMNRKINQMYDDEGKVTKRKITKKEKIGSFASYLTKRFSEEINIAFEESGKFDMVGLAENPSAIRDPVGLIEKMFPEYPKENVKYLVKNANEIVNQVMQYSEPQHYDFAYNFIKNKIMLDSAYIKKEQLDRFNYQYRLKMNDIQEKETKETEGIPVPPSSWSFPRNLILLSMVLYIMSAKSN